MEPLISREIKEWNVIRRQAISVNLLQSFAARFKIRQVIMSFIQCFSDTKMDSFTWKNIGNCHPEKSIVDLGEVGIDPDFIWVTVTYVTLSLKQYILYNTECLLNYLHYLNWFWFQNNPGQLNIRACISKCLDKVSQNLRWTVRS